MGTHKGYTLFLLMIVILILLISLATSGSNEPQNNKQNAIVDPRVFKEFQSKDFVYVTIVLKEPKDTSRFQNNKFTMSKQQNRVQTKEKNANAQLMLLENLSKSDFELKQKLRLNNYVFGYVSREGLEKLRRNKLVEGIGLVDQFHTGLENSVPLIGAPDVWSRTVNGVNIEGKGQTICVIDSGVNKNHPDLQGKVIAEACFCSVLNPLQKDCCPNEESTQIGDGAASDDNGHGTFLTGILTANNNLVGVAPDVKIAAVKFLDSNGSGNPADLSAAVDWCRDNQINLNISTIVISSFGDEKFDEACMAIPFLRPDIVQINDAHDDNIFVSVLSGNNGFTDGISRPACAAGAVSVGATDDNDNIWSLTDRGELLDLMAPGVSILRAEYGRSGALFFCCCVRPAGECA